MRRFAVAMLSLLALSASHAENSQEIAPAEMEIFQEPPLFLLKVGDLAGEGIIRAMTEPNGPIPKEVRASLLLAEALKPELEAHSFPLGAVPQEVLPQKKGRPLAGDRPNSLQVFVDYSAISYLPLHWGTYQYGLKGRARFIGADGSVVWEKKCYIKHTKEDLRFQITRKNFDSQGQRIHQVVQAAAEECARLIASQT